MSKNPTQSTPAKADFEATLAELEKLVEVLEGGQLGLTESLERFERGVALSRECQTLLEQARLKVSLLQNPDDPSSAVAFAASPGD